MNLTPFYELKNSHPILRPYRFSDQFNRYTPGGFQIRNYFIRQIRRSQKFTIPLQPTQWNISALGTLYIILL